MTSSFVVRPGCAQDLPALNEIYNHYVRESHATFDLEDQTLERRMEWFAQFDDVGPYRIFVAEEDAALVGYVTSIQFRKKPAYAQSIETTVYTKAGAGGRGLGRALYDTLFEALATESLHRAYAGIALPNLASERLHLALGFRPIGVYREVGYKFDRYWDVAWFEKELG